MNPIFRRTELLLGEDALKQLSEKRVIIFGVGGVGSWCAESLIRTGIQQLTIVDSDRVCITNINLSINPRAEITALQQIFTAETAESFNIGNYDYVIDAIDSLKDKVLLIQMATEAGVCFFSSMGAALKMDPTRIKVAEFWKIQGDPLARALRRRFKRDGHFPKRKFLCVYSDELLQNKGHNATCGTSQCVCPKAQEGPGDPSLVNHEWCSSKAQINGTLAHITAIFGFMLAGLVIQDCCREQ